MTLINTDNTNIARNPKRISEVMDEGGFVIDWAPNVCAFLNNIIREEQKDELNTVMTNNNK